MLTDMLNRPLLDLRISVTDRCNFRCTYCMPADEGQKYCFMKRSELMTFEEIVRLAKLFVSLGVRKIRLTGGEPLLRKDIDQLVGMLDNIEGLEDLSMTTNGFLLKRYAASLKKAGLKRINVSLDALDDEVFAAINGVGAKSSRILEGMDEAVRQGMKVKVNMVVKRGMNDSQILPMAAYFKEKGITLRFIEFMDVGSLNGWKLDEVVTSKEIYNMISKEMPLEPLKENYYGEVAKRCRYVGTDIEVGFISSVSQPFCGDCTRCRLSADGKIYTCLFAARGTDLLSSMRNGASDEELAAQIKCVWDVRCDRYSQERGKNPTYKGKRIEMSYIGG
ncbi:cyclic pyranopterin monophosphate synthase [Weizmannia acidilactici]|uniref:GTP 3',8-cyclase n=1 Tax=Weizmannia acidilactici TaxID=2607726 RepID=A0A5J4JCC1_9BACI|nr:GTP 3',8-cyclase MoaA [Weizmannia acidilactici]GER66433.1 cyclic pyranopterin monophosphate synthase [Weizmannia acidilactici]GER69421.1 cyclic pyranopterin monophosphate synthase [Weizmannia acidilactici]GER72251.1 cyclic pyranopterin monophosphate synthase [Weizmannia acidilactici]